jgi:hypothetical protein
MDADNISQRPLLAISNGRWQEAPEVMEAN